MFSDSEGHSLDAHFYNAHALALANGEAARVEPGLPMYTKYT